MVPRGGYTGGSKSLLKGTDSFATEHGGGEARGCSQEQGRWQRKVTLQRSVAAWRHELEAGASPGRFSEQGHQGGLGRRPEMPATGISRLHTVHWSAAAKGQRGAWRPGVHREDVSSGGREGTPWLGSNGDAIASGSLVRK